MKFITDYRKKHLTILKNMYSGEQIMIEAAHKAVSQFEPGEQEAFNKFQVDVGNIFVEIKEELDQALEDLGEYCPEEIDPRKWNTVDWAMFELAIAGHKYEEILRTYAAQLPNIHLIWKEIDSRLDLP